MHKINPYIIFDFETGGLKGQKNAATEIAMLCIDGNTLMEVGRYESYIKPYLGYDYDQKALDFTGITLDLLENKGKPLQQVVKEMMVCIKEWHNKTSATHTKKPILIGHNPKFDVVFLQQIFKEAKEDMRTYFDGDEDFYGKYQPSLIDTIQLSKLAYGNDETMTSYNLTACVTKVGQSLPDAHKAINDVIATKELLIEYVNRLRSNVGGVAGEKIRFRNSFRFKITEPKA